MERLPDLTQRSRLRRLAEEMDAQHRPPEGETEAHLVGQSVAESGAMPSPLTRPSNAEMRASALTELQQTHGNAYVQRVIHPSSVEDVAIQEVQQRAGAGQTLDARTHQEMSRYLGGGLDHVRVHTDAAAVGMADELHAEAFTVGSNIFFAEGRYDAASAEGKGLIAHELTHVGQQVGFTSQVQRETADAEEQRRRATSVAPQPTKPPEEETP